MSIETIEHLMQGRKWEEASELCLEILREQPANVKASAYLGLCEYQLGDYEAAATHFRRATILDPAYLDVGIKLAQTLIKLGRHLEAYDVVTDFLRQKPSNSTLLSLAESLRHHVDERRLDEWEKTPRLGANHIDHFHS